MATVYLAGNEKITVFGPARVYGSAGVETVFIAGDARGVFLSPAVERADLAGRAGDYQFRGASGRVEIWQDGELVASIPATGAGGTEARFADGGAAITVNPETGAVSLGGRVLGPTAESVDIPLDPDRPSDPAVNPTPTPDPEPDPEPEPEPDPRPDPDPWDDPWFWPWPDPTPPTPPTPPASKDETLTIADVQGGAGARTLTGSTGKDTTFDLAGASGDNLEDLAITDPDGADDNDTLKIRADQAPKKVTNVENVEVTGTDTDNDFDAAGYTGLKKVTVSRSVDGDEEFRGSFHVRSNDAPLEIVAGEKVTQLSVSADGATIVADAKVTKVTVDNSDAGGTSGATVNSSAASVTVEIDASKLTGTLAVSGSSAAVKAKTGGDGIIDATNLGELKLLDNTAVTVENATSVDASALTSARLTLVGEDVEVKTATTGSNIDASNLLDTLTVKGDGTAGQGVTITTKHNATVKLDAGSGDGTPAIKAMITAEGGVTLSGANASAELSFADGAADAVVDAADLAGGLVITGNAKVSGVLGVIGGSGNDSVTLDANPQKIFTFNGGDDGGDDDELVVTDDVTLEDGSEITNVEKVTVSNDKTLTVYDTVFGDDAPEFALSGNLKINQTKKDLNLSEIKYGNDAYNRPIIAITGFSGSCTIELDKAKATMEEITIRTKGMSGGDLEGNATTIRNFNQALILGPIDRLVLEGRQSNPDGWIDAPVDSLEELYNAAGKDSLDEGRPYYGTNGADSFVIMATDDGIFAVKLEGVELGKGDDFLA